ncbi:PucR family transcriptional regulator [Streptomyces sp. BPTC-684]|uniref:PucR family transcriptional regulator n=1 Tax=Streptomyces sp. BPTC-684 TaxID=3043734 RepID=UPI0024B06BD8|nr:PucR family transcriptional regulator [Streptomyces sp. BPTC-684]WHM40536.1 helix-turn-helix domain-containing protein [Streptomyces sp. BPTC-684]
MHADGATARQRLVRALTRVPAVPENHLADLARSADWPLPDTVRIVAVAAEPGRPRPVLHRDDVLVDWQGQAPFLLIPAPGNDTLALVRGALPGCTAVVAPVVPRADAAASLRWARTLLAAIPEHRARQTRIIRVEDYLAPVLLLQDEALARLFRDRVLAPLAQLTQRQSRRTAETLLAWLETGSGTQAARTLGVHPQTVRYRLRQIDRLFGPQLADPQGRFELELALRALRQAADLRSGRLRLGAGRQRGAPEA